MPDNKTIREMSDEELKTLDVKLQDQKVELKRARFFVAQERNRREEIARAKARLEKLNPGERAALAKVIAAEGIESTAEVGTPGS